MGVPQLADLVLETANAPGTGAFTLGGAPDGRQTFADAFPNGGDVFYYATDGVQSEWGIGTLTVGSPNVLVRKTVIGNLFGTTAALNFTASVTVYSEVPAKNTPFLDEDGQLPVSSTPDFTRDVALSAKAADARYYGAFFQLSLEKEQVVSGPVTFRGVFVRDAAVGSPAAFEVAAGGKARWTFGRDETAETGSNTGSYFAIARYDDSGAYIDTPFYIQRDTGVTQITHGLTVAGTALVPDPAEFDTQEAINTKTAERRYAKLNVDVPIGVPQLWPLETPPSGWLALNGASFDKTQYPGLAAVYTSGVLPDMRGKFVRGWDNGAGIDPNDGQTSPGTARALLSTQTDALQNITGGLGNNYRTIYNIASGAFSIDEFATVEDWGGYGGVYAKGMSSFDASRVARTSTETRPTNVAWNMIVRAV